MNKKDFFTICSIPSASKESYSISQETDMLMAVGIFLHKLFRSTYMEKKNLQLKNYRHLRKAEWDKESSPGMITPVGCLI